MVKALKVKTELAQAAKELLLEKGWLASNYSIGRSAQRYVLFPLSQSADEDFLKKRFPGAKIEERNLQPYSLK